MDERKIRKEMEDENDLYSIEVPKKTVAELIDTFLFGEDYTGPASSSCPFNYTRYLVVRLIDISLIILCIFAAIGFFAG